MSSVGNVCSLNAAGERSVEIHIPYPQHCMLLPFSTTQKQTRLKQKPIISTELHPIPLSDKDRHMDKYTWVHTHAENTSPRGWSTGANYDANLSCEGISCLWGCPDVPVPTVLCEASAPRGLDHISHTRTLARTPLLC